MDDLSPMDVVEIYEFGTRKYVGYIRTITFSGAITTGTPGRPVRQGTIEVSGFGNLLATASLGINLGNFKSNFEAFFASATKLAVSLEKIMMSDTSTYSQALTTAYGRWVSLIQTIGANQLATYLGNFVDIGYALDTVLSPDFPRSVYLWTGTEKSITLWQAILPIIQVPFNEIWFDNGPRPVFLNNTTQRAVQLLNYSTTYAVFRATPFNGTVHGGTTQNTFNTLPFKTVNKTNLVRFDFSKTCDESYTVYNCVTPVMSMNTNTRSALGLLKADSPNLNKYLLRMLTTELFFARLTQSSASGTTPQADPNWTQINAVGSDLNQTLLNWFTDNDKYLSGDVVFNVPAEAYNDVYIGEKVRVEGITGSFYVEGVSHQWQMMGAMLSTLSVTRGWNEELNTPMTMTDVIFRSGIPLEDLKKNG